MEGACSGSRKRARSHLSHLQEGWGELWPGQTILKEKYKAPGHYGSGQERTPTLEGASLPPEDPATLQPQ